MSEKKDWENVTYNLSASRIKTHASCPKKYELKYIQELEAMKGAKGYGQLGSWVHLTLENVLSKNPNETNEQALLANFKREFFKLEDSDEIDVSAVDDRQKDTGLDCLPVAARFIATHQPNIDGLEVPVNFHIDNPNIDRTVYGKMDVVADGEVWDWKTGTIRETTERDELIQGSTYMAGYHKEYGELPKAIRFIYIKEEKQREIEPTEESWQSMVQYARRLVQDEEKGEFEAKPEQGKCYFCSYEMACPASKVGFGQINEAIPENPDLLDAI